MPLAVPLAVSLAVPSAVPLAVKLAASALGLEGTAASSAPFSFATSSFRAARSRFVCGNVAVTDIHEGAFARS